MLDNTNDRTPCGRTKSRTPCGRQYSRVIRWVNRAQSMSAGGKYSDAILDVECARAELDDARQELLLCHTNGRERKRVPMLVFVAIAAVCAVFLSAAPLQFAHPSAETSVHNDGLTGYLRPARGDEERREYGRSYAAADLASGAGVALCEEEFSEGDVFRLVEVGRSALQGQVRRPEEASSLVLDFN